MTRARQHEVVKALPRNGDAPTRDKELGLRRKVDSMTLLTQAHGDERRAAQVLSSIKHGDYHVPSGQELLDRARAMAGARAPVRHPQWGYGQGVIKDPPKTEEELGPRELTTLRAEQVFEALALRIDQARRAQLDADAGEFR